MNKAEEILSKHTGETGIYLTHGMIRGSDALEAMEEYVSLYASATHPKEGSAGVWRKASEGQPENEGQYFVKVCSGGMVDYLAPMVMERFIGKWVYTSEDDDDDLKVVLWLDESQSSATPTEDGMEGGWIDIYKKQPEIGDSVIGYRPFAFTLGDSAITILRYTGNKRIDSMGVEYYFERSHHVTHWQRLPAPPTTP